MTEALHSGSVGASMRVALVENGTPIDCTGATTSEIVFEKPDGTSVTKTASFFGAITDGVLEYIGLAGDFDAIGPWRRQGHVVIPSGEFYSDVIDFDVLPNLD